MPTLNIWVDKDKAATLSEENNVFTLAYTDEWKSKNGYAFSPHLEVGTVSVGGSVRNYFSNLLPEGQVLEGLSNVHQVSKYDVFGILRKVGKDCAGALVLLEEGENPTGWETISLDNYQKIDSIELDERITESQTQNTPIMFWKVTPRMSLAGVQNKLGVYLDVDENIYLPKDDVPTSHILKPDNLIDAKHKGVAANEYFCMQLAMVAGMDVPDTQYKRLPTPIYLIKRYDRIWTTEGRLIRSHQIDGCQALNLAPNQKYEQEYEGSAAGASLKDILEIAKLCKVPAVAQKKIIQWIIFNYLIGNSDAHAKNLSFLINKINYEKSEMTIEEGMQVAPHYDLICGTIYGYGEMAQAIGDEFEFGLVGKNDWVKLAKTTGINIKIFQYVAKDMMSNIDSKLPILRIKANETTRSEVIDEIVGEYSKHKQYLIESLLN